MMACLMHLLHKTPPNGLSGLFFDLAIELILYGNSLGIPFKMPWQDPHLAAFGFLFLYCKLALLPGTFLNTLLRLLDLNEGLTMSSRKRSLFIKFSIIFKYQ